MSGQSLKLIAIVTMLIDHIGLALFPDELIWRYIGRISFPIFAFLIVEGFVHTSNFKKYIGRILIFGILSEIPFNLLVSGKVFDLEHQNVFFTFAIGLIMLHFIEKNTASILNNGFLIMGILFSVILRTDYSIYGIGLIYIFYVFRYSKVTMLGFASLVSLISGGVQRFAMLSTIPMALYNGERGPKVFDKKYVKYMFYAFYPIHIIILVFIRKFIYG